VNHEISSERNEPMSDMYEDIEAVDTWIDAGSAQVYRDEPLAQDFARVAKCSEEVGEAIAALIGMTGQNPRKGFTHTRDDVLKELADVALTALCAIQHFTKDRAETQRLMEGRVAAVRNRVPGLAAVDA
jgi:hypothetical protein